jgi:type I site-specific restriction endonuclease
VSAGIQVGFSFASKQLWTKDVPQFGNRNLSVMTPEGKARQQIDAMLTASGWAVQTKDKVNLSARPRVAVYELSFATGEPDYTLFVDGKALGTVEAKPEGYTLTGVEEQSTKYVTGVPTGLPSWHNPLPFCYESTGSETRFTTGSTLTRAAAMSSRSITPKHCSPGCSKWPTAARP